MATIYFNAKIYTNNHTFAQAMLVEEGIIKKVGTLEEVLNISTDNVEKIDLEGRTVIPGFNDSHLHIMGLGQALSSVQLNNVTSIDEMITNAREFLNSNTLANNEVLIGRGWNQDYFTDDNRLPTKEDLDKITTQYPIIFTRTCGHMCVANTKALELANITKNTKPVAGGEIYKDETGEPNGLFSENAMMQIMAIQPSLTPSLVAKYLTAAMGYAASNGVTSLQTCDIRRDDWKVINEGYALMYNNNPNAVRTYHQSSFNATSDYREFLEMGCITNNGNDMFKYGPLKMFVDGSLGARTAYMRDVYADDNTTRGIPTMTTQELDEMVQLANDNNCQVAIHCIGDAAIEMVLDAYDKVIENGNNHLRHGIIHCQITDKPLVERFLENDILAYVQPIFIHYDMNVVEERVGKELASTSYLFGDMYRMGIHTSYGTDSPVEDLNPFENLYCAVTRKRLDGQKTYLPQQAVSIYDAIDQYTTGSAYASFEENKKGKLQEGYFADFTVLDRDIFTVDSEEIKNVMALQTYLNGKQIFNRI